MAPGGRCIIATRGFHAGRGAVPDGPAVHPGQTHGAGRRAAGSGPRCRLLVNVPGPTPPLFSALEDALARSTSPQVAAFVRLVFALHEATEVHRLLDTAGFRGVHVTKTVKPLALPL